MSAITRTQGQSLTTRVVTQGQRGPNPRLRSKSHPIVATASAVVTPPVSTVGTTAVTDSLEVAAAGSGLLHAASGYYIQLRSQTGGATYTSSVVTDSTGYWSITNVLPDTYEIWYSKSLAGPWTDSRLTKYVPFSRPWFDVVGYGADPTGVADSAAAINATLIAAAAGSGTTYIPGGTYLLNDNLWVPSNSHIVISPGAVLRQNYYHVFVNTNYNTTGNSNITIEGGQGQITGTNAFVDAVSVLMQKVTGLTIRNLSLAGINGTTTTYAAMPLVDCNQVTIDGVSIDVYGATGTSSNGLWVSGGNGGTISNCYIRSGDDSLAFSVDYNGATTSCYNWSVSNCYLASRRGRIINVGDSIPSSTLDVYNISVSNCSGVADTATNDECIAVGNGSTSTGTVHDVVISDIVCDGRNAQNGVLAYGVSNVTFENINILGPLAGGSTTNAHMLFGAISLGAGTPITTHVKFSNCVGSSNAVNYPSLAVYPGVSATGPAVSDVHFDNCQITGAPSYAMGCWSYFGAATGCSFTNCTVSIGTNGYGIYNGVTLANTDHIFANNQITAHYGWREEAGADYNLFIGNNVRGCLQAVYGPPGGAHGAYRSNIGLNPVGALPYLTTVIATPAFPGTGVAYTNATGLDCNVYVKAGTNSITAVAIGGTAITTLAAITTGTIGGPFRVLAGESITLTYVAGGAPAWQWFAD